MQISLRIPIFIGALLWFLPDAAAQKIHLLAAGDLSPAAGWGEFSVDVRRDLLVVDALFSNGVPSNQLSKTTLLMEDDISSSPESILQQVRLLKVAPEDTIVFYFSGHGEMDDHGHHLLLARGHLYRQDLLAALRDHRARLVVLLTDCCSSRSDGVTVRQRQFIPKDPPLKVQPLFQSLFLDPSGIADVNSSSPGENSFFRSRLRAREGQYGSLFTGSLATWFSQNLDTPRSWSDFVHEVTLLVDAAFRSDYPDGVRLKVGGSVQAQQTVSAITYPGKSEEEGPRVGLLFRSVAGYGAVILDVSPDSPAARVFNLQSRQLEALEPRQLIVAANGRTVRSAEDFDQELDRSAQVIKLRVRSQDGKETEVLLRMRY